MDLVSVIIPTYNRFSFLLNTIHSIRLQTYSNIEIIVVNDKSTQPEYYSHEWNKENIKIIHLEQNSKDIFGYASAGYVRNQGIKCASGRYIAFCDDDDVWFPNKLEIQIDIMQKTGCKMSCTDGFIGEGPYDFSKTYKKYNAEHFYSILQDIYKNKGSQLLENGFPNIWNHEFINIHNCIICSSVVLEKSILEKINYMKSLRNGEEDYDCWKRALLHTNCAYANYVCFYYDNAHGYGQNY